MENKEYLDKLVEELMEDPNWELPQELRFPLKADLAWTLLGI